MFRLPLLNILDELKHEDGLSYLQKIIIHLLIDGERSIKEIAFTLGISESLIRRRIPKKVKIVAKDLQDKRNLERDDLILERLNKDECAKSIAFDLDIPIHTVYRIIKKYKVAKAL